MENFAAHVVSSCVYLSILPQFVIGRVHERFYRLDTEIVLENFPGKYRLVYDEEHCFRFYD